MTDTYINWNPSPRFIKKAKKYYDLHQSGMTYRAIWLKEKKHSIPYITRMANWYKNNILNK